MNSSAWSLFSRRVLTVSAALSVLAFTPAGCSSVEEPLCTQIGCGGALKIDFHKQDPWAAGEYVVSVDADGVRTECRVTLPMSCDAPPSCGEGAAMALAHNGCALAPEEQSLAGIEWGVDAPAHVEISVTHDDVGIGDASFDPSYETHRPNGPECAPECTQAKGMMVMKLR